MEDAAVRIRMPAGVAQLTLPGAAEKFSARCGFGAEAAASFVDSIRACVDAVAATEPATIELIVTELDDAVATKVRAAAPQRALPGGLSAGLIRDHGAALSSADDEVALTFERRFD